jgi:hypothetical protein
MACSGLSELTTCAHPFMADPPVRACAITETASAISPIDGTSTLLAFELCTVVSPSSGFAQSTGAFPTGWLGGLLLRSACGGGECIFCLTALQCDDVGQGSRIALSQRCKSSAALRAALPAADRPTFIFTKISRFKPGLDALSAHRMLARQLTDARVRLHRLKGAFADAALRVEDNIRDPCACGTVRISHSVPLLHSHIVVATVFRLAVIEIHCEHAWRDKMSHLSRIPLALPSGDQVKQHFHSITDLIPTGHQPLLLLLLLLLPRFILSTVAAGPSYHVG